MVLTGSGVEQRIMITSGIPLRQCDEIIEGRTWKSSFKAGVKKYQAELKSEMKKGPFDRPLFKFYESGGDWTFTLNSWLTEHG